MRSHLLEILEVYVVDILAKVRTDPELGPDLSAPRRAHICYSWLRHILVNSKPGAEHYNPRLKRTTADLQRMIVHIQERLGRPGELRGLTDKQLRKFVEETAYEAPQYKMEPVEKDAVRLFCYLLWLERHRAGQGRCSARARAPAIRDVRAELAPVAIERFRRTELQNQVDFNWRRAAELGVEEVTEEVRKLMEARVPRLPSRRPGLYRLGGEEYTEDFCEPEDGPGYGPDRQEVIVLQPFRPRYEPEPSESDTSGSAVEGSGRAGGRRGGGPRSPGSSFASSGTEGADASADVEGAPVAGSGLATSGLPASGEPSDYEGAGPVPALAPLAPTFAPGVPDDLAGPGLAREEAPSPDFGMAPFPADQAMSQQWPWGSFSFPPPATAPGTPAPQPVSFVAQAPLQPVLQYPEQLQQWSFPQAATYSYPADYQPGFPLYQQAPQGYYAQAYPQVCPQVYPQADPQAYSQVYSQVATLAHLQAAQAQAQAYPAQLPAYQPPQQAYPPPQPEEGPACLPPPAPTFLSAPPGYQQPLAGGDRAPFGDALVPPYLGGAPDRHIPAASAPSGRYSIASFAPAPSPAVVPQADQFGTPQAGLPSAALGAGRGTSRDSDPFYQNQQLPDTSRYLGG